MTRRSTLAQIRFGTGFRPGYPGPDSDALMAQLAGPDLAALQYPEESWEVRADAAMAIHRLRRFSRESDEANERYRNALNSIRDATAAQFARTLARGVSAQDGLRERLTWFWADHFTTVGSRSSMQGSISAYVEEAIRPHVGGYFPDMAEAAILHPVMVVYLDQDRSYGPNSRTGLNRGASLNENLAREILELHMLGVGSGYTQADVREMAELLTGVSVNNRGRLVFRPANAEPGPETVMGTSFGGAPVAELSEVRAALRHLALRPETARHLAGKLAEHFVSDTPDPGMVAAMAETYLESGGHLGQMTEAMLAHRDAWDANLRKVKTPVHFLVSALRALDIDPDGLVTADRRTVLRYALRPMAAMGQVWQGAAGPDGFFDTNREWVRPQTLAARIGWSMTMPQRLRPDLPDPREFVQTSLRDAAGASLQWAAARAESRVDGIGLVLSSPEFQRS